MKAQRQQATPAQHTPVPWVETLAGPTMREKYCQSRALASFEGRTVIGGLFMDVAGGEEVAKANSEFIIRAVNSHDKLLAALKAQNFSMPLPNAPCHVGICLQKDCGHCSRVKQALDAIAEAEGVL